MFFGSWNIWMQIQTNISYSIDFQNDLTSSGHDPLSLPHQLKSLHVRSFTKWVVGLTFQFKCSFSATAPPATLGMWRICPYQRPSVPWKVVSTYTSKFPSYYRKTPSVDLPLIPWRTVPVHWINILKIGTDIDNSSTGYDAGVAQKIRGWKSSSSAFLGRLRIRLPYANFVRTMGLYPCLLC